MAKTPRSKNHKYMYYMTKNLREDLHDRLRMLAVLRQTTIEDALNVALEVGLPMVERQTAEMRRAKRVAGPVEIEQ